MRYPDFIERDFSFPDFYRVRMNCPHARLADIDATVVQAVQQVIPDSGIRSGDSVAVGVGSRGIANLPLIVRAVCRTLQEVGARPFIVPAMGSHGAATAEGQLKVLEVLGVDEVTIGVPIKSSLEVAQFENVFGEVPVYFSRDALNAEHSICINRIKPHTKFKASIESGLGKMLCIGMGKHAGALAFHDWALKHGFAETLIAMAERVIGAANFRFGIGIVEDAYDETAHVEALPAGQILENEARLLTMAKGYFPQLPVKQLDVLVVRQIGKEISGSGMDPNITGRTYDLKEDDFSASLQAARVAILNLSEATKGNAIGLGNADFITEKLFQQIDYQATLMNALTSRSLRKAYIPIRMPDEQKAMQACFTTLGPLAPEAVRALIIQDTRHVFEFLASSALLDELKLVPTAELLEKVPLCFDSDGNLNC